MIDMKLTWLRRGKNEPPQLVHIEDVRKTNHWYQRSWTELHDVGSSKVVNSAFIWLIMIPFLSRVLFAIHEEYGKDIKLPFNFLAFYYAAFFFTIASALFNWKCPKVVKLAPTFGAFRTGEYSSLELKNWFHDLVPSPTDHSSRDGEKILQFMANAGQSPGGSVEEYYDRTTKTASAALMSRYWLVSVPVEDLPKVHNLAINEANSKNEYVRVVATVCYGLGFILFGVVAIYNLCSVVRETVLLFQ